MDMEGEKILTALDKVLHFRKTGVPVVMNWDARGYALKIDDAHVRAHNLEIHTDFGGNGILAPEFDGRK